jgi:hypothetical protein
MGCTACECSDTDAHLLVLLQPHMQGRLEERKEVWGLFPAAWRVPQVLCLTFCKITKVRTTDTPFLVASVELIASSAWLRMMSLRIYCVKQKGHWPQVLLAALAGCKVDIGAALCTSTTAPK